MKTFVIVNECSDETVPGDLGIYDSVEHALRGFEPDDVYYGCNFIYSYAEDGTAAKLYLAGGEGDGDRLYFAPSEGSVPDLRSLLLAFADKAGIPLDHERAALIDIVRAIFERDPNPYAGL